MGSPRTRTNRDYAEISLWFDQLAASSRLTERSPLPGDREVDIAIVGAGLTGLWAAYYLQRAQPGIRIAVLEKEIAGFGASGRNGGWCSALFPASTTALARRHGLEQALAMRRAMIDTVDEVGRVVARESIDCGYSRGGTVSFARSTAQLQSARDTVADAERWGVDQISFVPDIGRRAAGGMNGARAATLDPSCARLQPAQLVRALATIVEARGARIFEHTTVRNVEAGRVHTDRGTVRSDAVVIATEAYSANLPRLHRRILPLYSLMVATEPLPDSLWDSWGIAHGQTFTDYRHLVVYGQRTTDNRLAFGGRGARYHWGSSIRDSYDRSPRVFAHLRRAILDMFPDVANHSFTHAWGGPLGVPRDWHASVGFDSRSRIATAGGYVGDGLSTTNLAGRTIADLVCGVDTSLTRLPWVGHRSPTWEVEPLRFVAANLGLVAMGAADVEERLTGRPSLIALGMGGLTGH